MAPGLASEFHPCPKPRPKALEKADDDRDDAAIDRAEKAKCHARSKGRCEVVWAFEGMGNWTRCIRRVVDNHHLISGIGRRNVGPSRLAEHRQDVCRVCHDEIKSRILRPVGPRREEAKFVRYERAR